MQDDENRRFLSKRGVIPVGVAVVVVLALFVLGQRSVTVRVAYPEPKVPITVFGLGTVEARVISNLGFEVSATLVELNVDQGDRVGKDAVLARLHSAEQVARVARAEAGVVNAAAAMNTAQAVVAKARAVVAQRQQTNARQQRLLAQNTVSDEIAEDAQLQQQIAAAELAVALSEVEVVNAKRADALAQFDYESVLLDHHILRAPYAGVVVERLHELGTVLNAGEPLFTLVDPATVWALAYVDESRAGQIRVGQPARVHLRSLPQSVFPGHVVRIDIESDRVNEERRVYVACDRCPETFHLGEQAQVYIDTGELNNAILIPQAAVAGFDGKQGEIWVVEDDELRRLTVEFGSTTLDGRLEIVSDLPDQVLVVTELNGGLKAGRRAKVMTRPTP